MKKTLFFLLPFLTLTLACEEADLSTENPAPSGENVEVTFVPYYADSALVYDTSYVNNRGNRFFIDSVSILVSDMRFYPITDEENPVDPEPNFVEFRSQGDKKLVGTMPPGGYNGYFRFGIGVDSAQFNELMKDPKTIAQNEVLNENLREMRGFGFDHLKIHGRLFDPMTTDSTGTLPFEYVIGSYFLADTISTEVRAFSVDADRKVKLVMICDLKPALEEFDIYSLRYISSDYFDAIDFQAAQYISDSLRYKIF